MKTKRYRLESAEDALRLMCGPDGQIIPRVYMLTLEHDADCPGPSGGACVCDPDAYLDIQDED